MRKTCKILTGGGADIRRTVVVGSVGGGRFGWGGTGGGGGGTGGLALVAIVVTLRSLSCSTWIVSPYVAPSSLWKNMKKRRIETGFNFCDSKLLSNHFPLNLARVHPVFQCYY